MLPLAILLLVNAAFNVAVWPNFSRRIAQDPRARDANGAATRFLIVHTVLIGAALLLAAVSAVAAIVCLIQL
ncbi:MAG TPA: MASE2 domain-containing protein [Pseudolysinimonas sp.]|nr:MASE2 domain-containing protein [Pseudolysinimonas sp.]